MNKSKSMKREEIEIMAPVGSWESLTAAVQGGANSVYFGIDRLNMRSQSTVNFTFNDLPKIVDFCRKSSVKTYLTINTVLYDHDLGLMHELVNAVKTYQVDAIIASDISAIEYANSVGVEVHISTQLNVSNLSAVKFFSKFADVIVLARELSVLQIAHIANAIINENICGPSGKPVRLELFVHGALCMAVSGKCYLSLHQMNKSANRGGCLQICRRGYIVTDKESKEELEIDDQYIMSPKDLCTIDFLNIILDSGIRVLKIEGRARSADYVKTVVECYNQAVNSYFEGTYNREKIDIWKEKLATVFNRGFWDGYYLGRRLGEWSGVYGSKATVKKIYIGKGTNYFNNIKVAEFIIETGNLKVGDSILITGPTTGVVEFKVPEIRVDLKNVEEAGKGDKFSMPIDTIIRRSDKLYKLIPAS
jgi:U32 family peptidase